MTAPLAALLAAAWTLIAVIGVWSVVGLLPPGPETAQAN